MPDPGRLQELLLPGVKILLKEENGVNRKTRYSTQAVYSNGILISLNTLLPNKFVEFLLLVIKMAEIIVETLSSSSGGAIFQVTVRDETSQSKHRVRMSHDYHQKLANGKTPEEFIKTSFEFLLSKEPKESILSEFDLPKISTFFPEFEEEIKKM